MNQPISPDLVPARPVLGLVAEAPAAARPNLGSVLVAAGKLDAGAVERVVRLQQAEKLRFGDAAVKLALVSRSDVEAALAQQFSYGYLRGGDARVDPAVVVASAPFSPEAEAYRALRTRLALRWFDARPTARALVVVGLREGPLAALVVANLAVAFAQTGHRTLAVDASLRQPVLHDLFGLEAASGLSTLLAGRSRFDAMRPVPELPELLVLPAGPVPPNPQELLLTAFPHVLESAKEAFDIVLVLGAPAVRGADLDPVAAATGAALLVARRGRSPLPEVASLSARLRALDVLVAGTVLDVG